MQLERAFSSLQFDRPVDFQHAGNLLFVVEQGGIIHVFDNDPAVSQATVFLNIQNKVSRAGNEEGLLAVSYTHLTLPTKRIV